MIKDFLGHYPVTINPIIAEKMLKLLEELDYGNLTREEVFEFSRIDVQLQMIIDAEKEEV